MTSDRECYVYIVLPDATQFVTAGRLRTTLVDGVPVGRFVYGRSYRERREAVELDPVELRLSARSATYSTGRMGGFFGAIRDAMPDYWGRLVIDRHAGVARLDDFDYLLHGPDDRVGALGFGLNVAPPAPLRRFNRTLDLGRLQATADRVVAGRLLATSDSVELRAEELLGAGTSLGGARPKAMVADADALWIAKFARRDDRWNVPRAEHAMLALARKCGIASADSRIAAFGDRDALLVPRFDRDWQGPDYARSSREDPLPGEGGFRRARVVSASTVLQTDDSVTERGRWSYLLFADEIRRIVADARSDLRELFTRMCFNAAISNLDDHPRNHAIVAKRRAWRLAPAYDLTPSPVLATERRDLAMACGREGRLASRANLMSACGRFLLRETEAAAIFDRVLTTVGSQWRSTMRRSGVSEADCALLATAFVYPGLQGAGATDR
ncbi:MAG: HipA domain-containing protein [Gammaproteobacteria bacterium]|nr:HipA domain-containing protein [Gammaproteobacteria bacterium]